jgi:hypothetical protein
MQVQSVVRSCGLALVLFSLGSCKTTESHSGPLIDAPPASVPSGVNISAVLRKGDGWVNVGPNGSGAFEVLPGALPSGGMRFYFYAPWPAAVKVLLDGVELPKFDEISAGSDPAVTGYHRMLEIRVNNSPPIWTLGIRPPNDKLSKTSYAVSIASVSLNPKYAVGTAEHESAPLTVSLAPQKVSTITVVKAGAGEGTVTSNPAGISCGSECTADFGPAAFTTQLQASPKADSSFTGWSSPGQSRCSGTGHCIIDSTGSAITVTATFSFGGSGQSVDGCPGPENPPGMSYVGRPGCATNDIAGHPSAELRCDANGFFCCESVTSAHSPRCGGQGKKEFPEDCMDFGPTAQLVNHRGCFIRD